MNEKITVERAVIDAAVFTIAHADEGLRGLNMSEGWALYDLLSQLGYEEAGKAVLADVWFYEAEGSRDPEPMLGTDGGRFAPVDGTHPAYAEKVNEAWFNPRRGYIGEDDKEQTS